MNITVFGPLKLNGPEHLGPRERVVLSTLLLFRNQPVRTDTIADALWSDAPPLTWRKQLQASVVRVRRAVGVDRIVTVADGYQLRAETDEVDIDRFDELIARARMHANAREPERAVTDYGAALALVRGTPWTELEHWPDAIEEIERIRETVRSAEEDLLHARLDAGDHRGVAADAVPLCAAEPLRERRWAALALAQFRSGQQADALATLRKARRVLAEELGAEPGAELRELEAAVLHQDPALLEAHEPAPLSDDCPYQGLAPYGMDDAELFFGRDGETRIAVECLSAHRFLLLAGPSGSGKSSLLRAGVAPIFASRGLDVRFTTPSAGARGLPSADDGSRLLVVVDQFEELFAPETSPADIRQYCESIAALVSSGCRVAVVVRSDLLDACARQDAFTPFLPTGLQLLTVPGRRALRETIERPAQAAGLQFESGLVDLLLDDAEDHPGVLPLLSHALAETWRRREGALLTLAGYSAAGGLSGAVARSAEHLFQSLSAGDREACQSLLMRLVSLTASRMTVQQPVSVHAFGDAAHERVIGALAQARLLTVESETVALSHESLARAWPRLRTWLEEDADGKRALDHLASAAAAWEDSHRSDDELYRGARLETVLEWQHSRSPKLTASEKDFLEASVRRRQEEADERLAAAERDARQNVRLRRLLVASAALLVIVLIAGGLAVFNAVQSQRAEAEAQLSALVSSSESLRTSDRATAALLAVEAYRRWPDDPRSRSALLGTFTSAPGFLGYSNIKGAARPVWGKVLADGARAVVALGDRSLALVDLASGDVVRHFDTAAAEDRAITSVGASGDGTVAVLSHKELDFDTWCPFASGCNAIQVLDLGTGAWRTPQLAVDREVGDIAVNQTGSITAILDRYSGDVLILSLSRASAEPVIVPSERLERETHGAFGSVEFRSDGTLMVGSPASVRLVDPKSGAVTARVNTEPFTANQAVVEAGDGTIVASGEKGITRIDVDTGRVEWTAMFDSPMPAPCARLTASAVSGTVYCGDEFGGISERRLDDGELTGTHLDPQHGDVGELSVSPDGSTLASVGFEAPLISRWRLDGSGPVTDLVAQGMVVYGGYDLAGERLLLAARTEDTATVDDFNDFWVWDPASDRPTTHLPEPVRGLAWTGGDQVAGWSLSDFRYTFFNASSGEPLSGDLPFTVAMLSMSESGNRAFAGLPHGAVWTLDGKTREQIRPTMQVHGHPYAISTNADDSRVLVSGVLFETATGNTSLFDGETGELLGNIEGPFVSVMAPDGTIFASDGGRIVRYDAQLRPLDAIGAARGYIHSLALSDDGSVLLAAAGDQTVSLFDTETGVRLGGPITADAPFIIPGFLRPDGMAAAVTGKHGVLVWDLDPEHLAKAACTVAGRNLTAEEWSRNLAALGERRDTCDFGEG